MNSNSNSMNTNSMDTNKIEILALINPKISAEQATEQMTILSNADICIVSHANPNAIKKYESLAVISVKDKKLAGLLVTNNMFIACDQLYQNNQSLFRDIIFSESAEILHIDNIEYQISLSNKFGMYLDKMENIALGCLLIEPLLRQVITKILDGNISHTMHYFDHKLENAWNTIKHVYASTTNKPSKFSPGL